VTELANGQSLRVFCGAPRPIPQVAYWRAQIARVLAVAHGESIVHSDMKTENIMLRGDGYIKILDFGLAQTSGAGGRIEEFALGTLGYTSTEQTRGEPLTGASDVFAGRYPARACQWQAPVPCDNGTRDHDRYQATRNRVRASAAGGLAKRLRR
jgi:serine/threonine protein kinase